MRLSRIILFLLISLNSIWLYGQAEFKIKEIGTPFIEIFSKGDYDGSNQVWAITQDTSGLMYFGLQNRLLEYDGVTFKPLKMKGSNSFRALEITEQGSLYYGNYNKFGKLSTDGTYSTNFQQLQSHLNLENKEIGRIRNIKAWNNQLVIHSYKGIFLMSLEDDSFYEVPKSKNFNSISLINGRLLAVNSRSGIYELVRKELLLLTGIEKIEDPNIRELLPFSDNELLLTSKSGLYKYDFKEIIPWDISISEELNKTIIFSTMDIKGQYTSISTWDNGLFIIDRRGKLVQRLTKSNGLSSNQIYCQYLDKNNSLWLGTADGINHVFIELPFTLLDQKSGIEGAVLRIRKHKGYLYVATQQGIFYRDMNKPWQTMKNSKQFIRLGSHSSDSWWFESMEGDLFCATRDGLLRINQDSYEIIFSTPLSFIYPIDNNTFMAIGGQASYKQYLFKKKKGKWSFVKKILGLDDYADFIQRTEAGKFWHSNVEVGLFSYSYDDNYDSTLFLKKYDEKNGLPDVHGNFVYKYLNEPIFGTLQGLMTYNEREQKFVKDHRFDQYNKDHYVFKMMEFDNQDVYLSGGTGKMYLHRTSESEIKYNPSRNVFNKVISYNDEFVYPLYDKSLLVGSALGVLHYDASKNFNPSTYSTTIRSVYTTTEGDSLVFGGMGIREQLNLSYQDNGLKFSFASTFYDENVRTRYSYRLKGFEDKWSDWSEGTDKEYTNLAHGGYSFFVKSKNIYNKEGSIASFNFTILPPWYFTSYAYIGYFLVFILFVWSIVKLNSQRLIKEKRELEKVVLDRTEEIREQKNSIEKQAKRLQEMDNVKSRFFANISHELRTPITLINGPVEAMINGEYGKVNNALNKGLNVVRNNGKNLLSLVNEILDLTKLEAGKLRLIKNPVHFYSYLKEIFDAYKLQAEKKEIDLEFNYRLSEDLSLLLDESKFKKIVDNLLSNALKFSNDGSNVTLEVNRNEQQDIVISIKDTGLGIHADDLPKIFDRFYQSEQPNTKIQGGTGIGLALAKELTKLQGGNLEVESELGQGSTFKFIFSAETALVNKFDFDQQEIDLEQLHELMGEAISKYAQLFDKEKPLLLIVEDHEEMRAFIKKILESHFEILESGDGREALTLLSKSKIDLVISDVMMPIMDGFELLESVKNETTLKSLSMIMLTARAAEEDKLFALTLGVDDYLTKPFSAAELLARIKNILDNRMLRKLSNEEDKGEEETNVDIAFINTLKEIVEKNISDSLLSVSYLASQMAISERQLLRRIKSITGFSPIKFIREVKLQYARKLLEKHQVVSVAEASYSIGYDNVNYFSSQYIDRFGKRPSESLSS